MPMPMPFLLNKEVEGKSRGREGVSVRDGKEGYDGEVGSMDDYIDHGGPQEL